MYKLIAIFTLILALMNLQAAEINRKAEDCCRTTGPDISAQRISSGISSAAYHEPECGIGEAAYHEPECGIGEAAYHVPGE